MSINLPVPWIGGDLAGDLPEDPVLLRKALAEKLAEIQQNFEALSRKSISGAQDLPNGAVTNALPSSPRDGQVIDFQSAAMESAGIVWRFRYNEASSSALKWEFVGGSDLYAEAMGAITVTNTAYQSLTVALTAPLAGDYLVTPGAYLFAGAAGEWIAFASFSVGGTGASDDDAFAGTVGSNRAESGEKTRLKTGVAASTVFTLRGRGSIATATDFYRRTLRLRPRRVG